MIDGEKQRASDTSGDAVMICVPIRRKAIADSRAMLTATGIEALRRATSPCAMLGRRVRAI